MNEFSKRANAFINLAESFAAELNDKLAEDKDDTMNSQDILSMAREVGCPETEIEGVFRVNRDDLGRLLAEEREACAKVCESMSWAGYSELNVAKEDSANECATAIRSRCYQYQL